MIQGFELPSIQYGVTMTGAIAVKDALQLGFVATGDGCDYVFTLEEILYLRKWQAEQFEIDEEFRNFCRENGVEPEQADDTDLGFFLQGFINTQKGLVNK